MEQKVARREAARERDASPDQVKLPGGGDVMGGGDSFAAARAAQQARSARWARDSAFRVVECAHHAEGWSQSPAGIPPRLECRLLHVCGAVAVWQPRWCPLC